MITFPNCKINLGLWVIQRRTDGYHNIQTVMIPVPWCDILEIVPANDSETTLIVTGNQFESPIENNLCYKAWKLMADQYTVPPVSIHLHKVIPTGAGLGGGSSDASFTLRMLNSMFQLNLDNEILRSLAVQLGMDCPFFIENVPALSTGRGEFLKPVSLNFEGFYLVIVKPEIHVSTAAAFLGIKPVFRENSIDELTSLPIQEWKKVLHNDFDESVFALYPEIQEVRNLLYRHGAIYAAMSGSGSAVFGLFARNPGEMDFPGCDVFRTLLGSHP
ncbi:MAG: 4-(cytidine 5'-diphospho)-2-C-methyl-D-erythritol kinase [Lentimicrobiaceae bacterium]|jgi:4-diphosphocytidyl-2-C-methyl-D-erythritol kinase